ncbi:hypothetical protein Tco_0577758 [Tanacetum coccineum]
MLLPSTTHRDDLLEADMPLQKRAHFIALTSRFEVGESSSPAAARQAGQTLAHRVDYGFVDTVDTSIRASESRAMTAIGEVNERVTDLAATQRQDAQELYVHYEDKIPPKKRTATTTTTTKPMTDAQLKALIAQGVADALAERDADKAGMATTVMIQGVTKEGEYLLLESVPTVTRPLNFMGTEGVFGLT